MSSESDITDIQSQIDETRKDQQTLKAQKKILNGEIDSLGTDCSGIDPTDPTYGGSCNCSGSPACTAADFKIASIDQGTEESTTDATCLSDLYQAKPSLVGFSSSCKRSMNNCGLVKCLEKVESDQKQLKDIQAQLDSDKSDLQDYTQELTDAQKACPNCQMAEHQEEASQPSNGQLLLSGLQSVLSAGVSGLGIYSQIHGQNEYYSSIKDQLNECATIGVPCSSTNIGMYGSSGMSGYGGIIGSYGESSSSDLYGYSGDSPYTEGYGVPTYPYGAGFSSGLNPYGSSSSYLSTYEESLEQQALMSQQGTGSNTNESSLMMSEMQVYQAQAREMQLLENGGYGGGYSSYGSSLYGTGTTAGLGQSF